MDFFNLDLKIKLNKFLKNQNDPYQAFLIYGNLGCGKSYTIYEQLEKNHTPYQIIAFSEEDAFPFRTVLDMGMEGSEEEQFLMKASKLFEKGQLLVFENLDLCGQDHLQLISRLLKYHKISRQKARVIFEYNTDQDVCDCMIQLISKRLFVQPIQQESFLSYLTANFYPCDKNERLFEKIVDIARGNLQSFFITLNILKQLEIIIEYYGKFRYIKTDTILPNNLLSLYGKLFDELDNYMQSSLRIAAPFSPNIYCQILKSVVQNFSNFENYLDELSRYNSLIKQANQIVSEGMFQCHYAFLTKTASQAICEKLSHKEFSDLTKTYYDYLDKIYHNRSEYNLLSESDKLHLLMNLTKNRRGHLTVNQIPLVIDIMNYYYNHFLYFSAVEHGNSLLNACILNEIQLNAEYHTFYVIYFRSLLAVGNYDKIIYYKNRFQDEDLNFIIALAFYNRGQPSLSLEILKGLDTNIHKINYGYKASLTAAIFDWMGNNKKSFYHFKAALRTCQDDPDLKYQLLKKYSMYIDFGLPECRMKMQQACDFYRHRDQRQYAECLHNYGTGCVMDFSFEDAKNALYKSRDILTRICNEQVYHPLNSLAILACFASQDFNTAIQIWEDVLKYPINIDFCALAIRNNCFNAYIHTNNFKAAEALKISLESSFSEVSPKVNLLEKLKEIRPDIQHQLRQFYYNCAILDKVKGDYEQSLKSFYMAKKCSNYQSVVQYSIFRNIFEIETLLHRGSLWHKKLPQPTRIEKFMYEHNMYLCEIMFWG